MTDYPTVGLKVDLSGIDQGEKAYDSLKAKIEGVGRAADATGEKVSASARKSKSAGDGQIASTKAVAAAAEKAARDEERAAARAAKEQERQRKYLQQVRINSMRMEEAARRAAEVEEARAAARAVQQAQRVAREAERADRMAASAAEKARREEVRAAEKAARDQEAIERGILNFRIRMRGQEAREANRADSDTLAFRQRMWAQQIREAKLVADAEAKAAAAAAKERIAAEKRASAEAEANRKYLLRVRLNSIKMEEAEQRRADAEALRRAREIASASRRGGGGGGFSGGGGGGSAGGDLPSIGAVTLLQGAFHGLRRSLMETRRLFFDLRTAVGLFLGGLVVKPIIDMADAMTALRARAAAFTNASTDVPYLMEAIFATAQRARTPLEAIATLYTRLAPLAKQLGKSQMELLRITETVAKGFQIGGATPEEARSASQQLAQALASNRLGGDELRSLAENAPILMAKIAAALNMNTGEFIKWAQAGKANAAVVIGALEKAQADIDRIFAAFPVTIGQAVTMVTNSLTVLVGKVNDATGATVAIGGAIANFAGFLDEKSTVDALTKAVNFLGKAFELLGNAMSFVGTMIPVIATILALMAVSKLMAIAGGWAATSKAMLAYQAAAAIAGRATATLAAAQTGLAAAAAAAGRALGSLLALVGGPLGAAVIAIATAFTFMKKAQDDAASASDRYKSSQEGAIAALSRASDFAKAYGINTDSLTKAMNSATGATNSTTVAHDAAMKAAMARAEAERLLTVRLLEREAAEAGKEARRSLNSVTGITGLRNQRRVLEFSKLNPLQSKEAKDAINQSLAAADRQIIDASKAAIEGFGLQRMLKAQADELRKAKLTVTIPDVAGDPAAPKNADGKAKRNPFEGALDGVQKLKAAIAGLRAEIATLSANPLDALSAQIIRAGDEAAASLEAGDKKNAALAAETRRLAMEKERLSITKQMLQQSADNTRQTNMEAAANEALGRAQLTSTQIMKDFWGSGSRTLEGYNAALARSRQVQADAEVASSDLNIAQRYGVKTLGEIAAAYASATGETEEYAQKVQAAAVEEAAAAAAAIRRKAALDALASQDTDLQAFNSKTYEEAQDVLQHMVMLTDNLGDSLAAAFGRGGAALGRMLQVLNSYSTRQLEVNRRVAEAQALYGKGSGRALDEERRGAEEMAQAQIESYAEMAAAAKSFFKEGTAGYKALQIAETAFRVYEFAMSAKSIAIKAVETAAKIGFFGAQAQAAAAAGAANMFATLGPAGFAAVAAMVAVLAGLGVALKGGGGRGSVPTSEDRQKAQGAGSVLGDAEAKSESISRALEIVASNTNESLEYSNDMLAALRSIDSNISALTTSLARQLGVGGFLSTDVAGLGTQRNGLGTIGTILTGGLSKLPVVGGILNTLFGTTKKTTLQDAGISFGSGSLADILSKGISGQTYQDIATQTKKKFFGVTYSNKTSVQTNTAALDAGIAAEITRVIDSLRSGVLAAAGALGVTGAQAALDAMTVDLGKISFKDMTGEEIEQALQAIFSKLGDDMATIALPMVTELQKAGEGAFETLARIARDYQVVDVSLKSIGLTFGAVGTSSIKARERLIELSGGIDQFASQTAFFAENFLTDQERIAPVITAVYTELGKLGYGSIKTKDEFKKLVQSLDLTTEQGAAAYAMLMKIAPGFAQIVEYTESLTAANDNVSDAQSKLNDVYSTAADLIGETRDKFAGFVETFSDFLKELNTGPLAANSPQDQYLKTKAAFESTRSAALRGDEKALADLQSVSQAYLEASKDYYASTEPYFQDLAAVKAAIEQAQAYAQSQVNAADQQLAALNQLVSGYITINTSVLTVTQAVNNVHTAILDLKTALAAQAAALAAAQQAANGNATPSPASGLPTAAALDALRYGAANPDLVANYNSGGILAQTGLSLEDALRFHYQNTGMTEIGSGGRQLYGDIPATQAQAPAPAPVESSGGDVSALTAAVEALTKEAQKGNVINQEGYRQMLPKLNEIAEGQDDLKNQIRASAA